MHKAHIVRTYIILKFECRNSKCVEFWMRLRHTYDTIASIQLELHMAMHTLNYQINILLSIGCAIVMCFFSFCLRLFLPISCLESMETFQWPLAHRVSRDA